jgi:ABC-type nitrate/sulfonate/bicarbonate transport system ATPase subunit
VLGEFSMVVANGEFALGCGKSMLLHMFVGFDHDFQGSIQLPAHGRFSIVFQQPARRVARARVRGRT